MSRTSPARATSGRPLRFTVTVMVVAAAAVIGVLVHPTASSFGQGALLDSTSAEDGVLPAGATVLDHRYAGVAKLDAALLAALREAATDAAGSGIELHVNSGWRSREYQNRLLHQAVAEYGSLTEARRWVATADTSAHVSGDAVDIGPADATAWLSRNGADYGLCQIYLNEPWHYELRPGAVAHGCPRMYADPTDDPRMQR